MPHLIQSENIKVVATYVGFEPCILVVTQVETKQRFIKGLCVVLHKVDAGAHFHLDCYRTNVLDNTNSVEHLS